MAQKRQEAETSSSAACNGLYASHTRGYNGSSTCTFGFRIIQYGPTEPSWTELEYQYGFNGENEYAENHGMDG